MIFHSIEEMEAEKKRNPYYDFGFGPDFIWQSFGSPPPEKDDPITEKLLGEEPEQDYWEREQECICGIVSPPCGVCVP